MFEEVTEIYETEATNEDEIYGWADQKRIRLRKLLDWMEKVNASQNVKFLKCLNWKKNNVVVNNIDDITFSANILHKQDSFNNAVKIAFKEDPNVPAMTFKESYELLAAIASKCEEDGIDVNEVEVFLQDVKDKLTQFSWYYDTDQDVACLVKNMSTADARRFMHNGVDEILARAAKTANTPDSIIDELAKIEKQMQKLSAKRDVVYKRLEDMPTQA